MKTMYDILSEKQSSSFAAIYYNNCLVSLKSDGMLSYIEIHYSGMVEIRSLMPASYHIFSSKTKIIILLFGVEDLKESLFEYRGIFEIKKAVARNIEGNLIRATVTSEAERKWNLFEANWGDADYAWNKDSPKTPVSKMLLIQRKTHLERALQVDKYQRKHAKKKSLNKTFRPSNRTVLDLINTRKKG